MKLFYFGSVRSNEVFNETVKKSKVKPSAAAQNFEYALIKGFSENKDVDICVVSAESIAPFPRGNKLILKKRKDVLTDRAVADIVPAINLPAIKQNNHANGVVRRFKKWAKANKDEKDKCVLVYGLYALAAKKLLKACKKYDCKIFAVITDAPSTMFTYTEDKSLFKRLFKGSYRDMAVSIQDKFDGYVYLTDAMTNKVAPGKPYIVVETIVDTAIFGEAENVNKATPPALMYAGSLYQNYKVELIMDIFEEIKTDCELWFFGSGDCEEKIIKRSEINPKIKFFGRVSREEVLKKEQEATLLLNVRDPEDEYTKFSFPSKMIEYLLSGTPLLTTKLLGIPEEYYEYCYSTNSQDPKEIALLIDEALTSGKMGELGAKAKKFVTEEKNYRKQANRITGFLNNQL